MFKRSMLLVALVVALVTVPMSGAAQKNCCATSAACCTTGASCCIK